MLALIAGTGALPDVIGSALTEHSQAFVVCEMAGFAVNGLSYAEKTTFRIETLGTLLSTLTARGVTKICFAGAIQRPPIDPSAIDPATLPLVPKMMAAIAKGDDGALRTVIEIFEEAGFEIIAPHDIAPDLLPPAGLLAGPPADASIHADLATARAEHALLSAGDIGQAVVTANGNLIASEDRSGTDAMLTALIPPSEEQSPWWQDDPLIWTATLPLQAGKYLVDWIGGFEDRPHDTGPAHGGLLYKAPKTGQDLRIDLPVIGPRTIMLAAEAGLASVVIAAGGVMVLDQPQVTQIARAMNIRLWVREAGP